MPKSPFFRWVIKWQNPHQTECEYISTQFYKRTFEDLSVPEVKLVVDEDLKALLFKFFEDEGIVSYYTPLIMEYKDGNNLFQFYKHSHIFKLGPKELHKLFHHFGRLIGYDLVIANCDRFLTKNFRGVINAKYRVNSGNIMIELVVSENSNPELETARLKKTHSIDNAPLFMEFFSSIEKKHLSDEDDSHLDGGFGLFEEEDDAQVELEEVEPDPPSICNGEQLREERHEDFKYFVAATEGDLIQMGEQSIIGIVNELTTEFPGNAAKLKSCFTDECNAFAIETGILDGLKRAQKSLRTSNGLEVIGGLRSEGGLFHPNAETLLGFIERNINYIQKI